jgi:hypothetical protein
MAAELINLREEKEGRKSLSSSIFKVSERASERNMRVDDHKTTNQEREEFLLGLFYFGDSKLWSIINYN